MDLERTVNTTCTSEFVEKLTKVLGKYGVVGTVLMDLSKTYDCLPRDLLLAKLSVNGFDESAVPLIANCLSNRYQRLKIGSTFSSYLEILRGVLQGSILSQYYLTFL